MAEKALTLRLDEATYERLRREAFEQRVPMSDIIRDSLTARFTTWDRDDSGPWPASREATRRAEHANGDPCPTCDLGEDAPNPACASWVHPGNGPSQNHTDGSVK